MAKSLFLWILKRDSNKNPHEAFKFWVTSLGLLFGTVSMYSLSLDEWLWEKRYIEMFLNFLAGGNTKEIHATTFT